MVVCRVKFMKRREFEIINRPPSAATNIREEGNALAFSKGERYSCFPAPARLAIGVRFLASLEMTWYEKTR